MRIFNDALQSINTRRNKTFTALKTEQDSVLRQIVLHKDVIAALRTGFGVLISIATISKFLMQRNCYGKFHFPVGTLKAIRMES